MAKKKQFGDYKTIKTTRTEYVKVGSKWKPIKKDKFLSSEKQHRNATDKRTCSLFRGLGGYERNESTYTSRGYKVVRNTSISPDGKTKIVRDYDFDGSDKLYERANKNYYKSLNRKKR